MLKDIGLDSAASGQQNANDRRQIGDGVVSADTKGSPSDGAHGDMLFVTGASRSGTTMLARLLGSHTRIFALNELHFFGELWEAKGSTELLPDRELVKLAATLLSRQMRGLWAGEASAAEIEQATVVVSGLEPSERTAPGVFAATVRSLAQEAGKDISCEQTPRNVFYARQLLSLYPEARIVHIVRDPRAVLASQKNRWKLRRLGARHLPIREVVRNWVNYHPITMTRLWIKATEEALGLRGEERVMLTRFEDLAGDPEGVSRQICDFVGVDFERSMIDIPRWGSSNLQHSSSEKGISRQVVDEWKQALPAAHALICEKMAAPFMRRLGYPPEQRSVRTVFGVLPSLLYYPVHAAAVLAFNPGRAWILVRALRGAQG